MDLASKKRKAEENGVFDGIPASVSSSSSSSKLVPAEVRRIIDPLTKDQLLDILQDAVLRHTDVLDSVRSLTDGDISLRKLFIRGLGWDTTTDGLRNLFSAYGELQEAIVIVDKSTGKSKGYGFITFKHIDGAILALREPSKLIDGRMTVTQLASAGPTGGLAGSMPSVDVSLRKIFVGNVPFDMPADRLLMHFLSYGEIEEGPLGFDKQTGKSKGYALFVYKTAEGARASLVDPVKMLDGHQVVCKLAIEGKKMKSGTLPGGGGVNGQTQMGGGGDGPGDGLGLGGGQSVFPGTISGSYPGGLSSFGGYSGGGISGSGIQASGGIGHPLNSSLPSSLGVGSTGLPSIGSQVGGGAAGGFGGSGLGGLYGGSSQLGGTGTGGYGGLGVGPSAYQMPPSSSGLPSGSFPEGGHYGISGTGYQSQHHQPAGSSPSARVPPRGGMYQGMPPYY